MTARQSRLSSPGLDQRGYRLQVDGEALRVPAGRMSPARPRKLPAAGRSPAARARRPAARGAAARERPDPLGVGRVTELAAIQAAALLEMITGIPRAPCALVAAPSQPVAYARGARRASALASPAYAASRTRMWREAERIIGRERARLGHDHLLRTSAWRRLPRPWRAGTPQSSRTAPHEKTCPTTEARWATSRSAGSSWSRRAAAAPGWSAAWRARARRPRPRRLPLRQRAGRRR